jgi:hypothetical protein
MARASAMLKRELDTPRVEGVDMTKSLAALASIE